MRTKSLGTTGLKISAVGLGYTPFSPLPGGFLTGKYRLETRYPDGSRMNLRPEPYLHL